MVVIFDGCMVMQIVHHKDGGRGAVKAGHDWVKAGQNVG